jgi:outer membrane biosynthesis protein TonB
MNCRIFATSLVFLLAFAGPVRAHEDVRPEDKSPLQPNEPMKIVSDQMKTAEQELSNSLTGTQAQTAQENALSILDQLLQQQDQQKQNNQNNREQKQQKEQEQHKQQKEQQKDKQSQQEKEKQQKQKDKEEKEQKSDPTKPGKMSASQGSESDQKELDAAGKEWGSMPPQLRRELIHSMQEDLPEKYKELLKLYYKRLSEIE